MLKINDIKCSECEKIIPAWFDDDRIIGFMGFMCLACKAPLCSECAENHFSGDDLCEEE
jgi:hypothetical protein